MLDRKTKLGHIRFSGRVIKRIVMEAADTCEGKVQLYNYKGRYKNMVPDIASMMNLYNDELSSIHIDIDGRGIHITVYVIISFGTSIREMTRRMIDYIYERTELVMMERPASVKVVVTGVVSKEIAKRHIEVSR